ncbi:MAG: NAD(+)/NADH kinase [Thermoleophilaceae bacterium]
MRQLGLVVHPTRPIEATLGEVEAWTSARGLALGQVMIPGQERRVAEPVEPEACDLLLALGGDGTALAALHAGAPASRPVLAIACGSIGALTSVGAKRVAWALDQFASGHWTATAVPGLDLAWDAGSEEVAINDAIVIRDGPGQIVVSIALDDAPYAQIAGDGVVVATALGSSAYTMAAGGPLLAPGAEGMVLTPLAAHGGVCPPLVAGGDSRLTLRIEMGYGGARCERDGHPTPIAGHMLTVTHRPEYAIRVALAGEESRLTGLRRRGLILDSPRALIRDRRSLVLHHVDDLEDA